MKKGNNNSIFTGWGTVILAFIAIGIVLLEPGYCQTEGTAVLLQQTPADGGKITPEAGIHHFDLYTEISLTAVPSRGYQFVYWLGDVGDSTSNSTVTYLDTPKIIIAVFERIKYEFLAVEERSQSMPGGGRLTASAADYSNRGYSGGGGKRPHKQRGPGQLPEEQPEEQPDFPPVPENGEDFPPVPGGGENFPVPEPIPEPATVWLLALGGLALLKRRRA